MATITAKLVGVPGALRAFEEMKNATRNRVVRKAARAGNRPQLVAVRQSSKFRNRTGLLRKSFLSKIRTYRQSSVTVAVTGPAFNTVGHLQTASVTWTPEAGAGVRSRVYTVRPGKYAPLVEGGHGGPAPAPAHPFMRSSFQSSRSNAEQRFTSKFVIETYAEAARACNNP